MSNIYQLSVPQFAFNHQRSAVVFMLKCKCQWKQQKRSWTPTYAQKEKNGQESVIIINQPKMSNKICLCLFYDSLVFAKSTSLSGCYVQTKELYIYIYVILTGRIEKAIRQDMQTSLMVHFKYTSTVVHLFCNQLPLAVRFMFECKS